MMKLDIQLFADGKVVIETELDTSGVDEDLEELYDLIDNSDFGKKTEMSMEGASRGLKKVKKEAQDVNVSFEDIFETSQQIGSQSGISMLDEQIALLQDELEALQMEYEDIKNESPYDNQTKDLLEYANKIDTTKKKITKLIEERDKLKSSGFDYIKTSIDGVGNSITQIIKRITKWGLAIFGIRSAYNAVRNAISVISRDDAQLSADIEYMKSALAYTLEPVVRRIVDLVKQLMFYIAYLAKAWFNINLFENANKSLKGANKQAKALSKTLAGFDEMNVLQDTSSSSSGGGATMPSFDLSGIENFEPPQWLITIRDIGQWILDNWEDVVFALLLTKLFIDLLTGNWIGVVLDLLGLLVLGFFKIKDAFGEIIDFIKERWENFKEWWNAIITVIVEWFKAKWEGLKNWFSTTLQKIGDFFSGLWNGAKNGVSNFISSFKEKFQAVKDWIKTKIIDPIKNFFGGMWDNIKTGASNGLNNVKSTFANIFNKIIDGINKFIRGLNKIQINIPDWLGGGNFGFNIREIPRLARGGIVNNPGRGVMMGNYIAGENGAEAVLPLTDDTLQKLANMIPITINLTNTMNGRVISRELQRVQNENDFAYNR